MKFETIDITWACKYVALAMDENEVVRRNMQDVIPRRKAKQGKKATMRTVVVDDSKERWKFLKSPRHYNSEEVGRVMSLLVECLVKITFSTHLYLWRGEVKKQRVGGPIGLRATGSCARIVMDKWLNRFRNKLHQQGVEVYLVTKYVDDVLVIAKNVQLGCYWDGNNITWSQEVMNKHLCSNMNRTHLTLDIFKQIANSEGDFLSFTGEASIDGNPIPCLDSQVWVGSPSADGPWYETGDSDSDSAGGAPGLQTGDKVQYTVLYSFYKKTYGSYFNNII